MTSLKDFLDKSAIKYRSDEDGSKHTTISTGGALKYLIEPNTSKEVSSLLDFLNSKKIPSFKLGAGSNLIIPDEGLELPVIRLGRGFRYYKECGLREDGEYASFEVGASMPLMTLSRELSESGFSGLEFAGGIPASLGGAVKMNAGAHGEEMSAVIKKVTVCLSDGKMIELSLPELGLSYRHSKLPEGSLVISAVISLKKGNKALIITKRKEFLEYRKRTQPLTMPTFGSVFKNPSPDKAAGYLIEKAGLKGHTIGGAKVSALHANWIVNEERKAKSGEVVSLISTIKEKVKLHSGDDLVEEVVYWGKLPRA